MIKLIAIIMLGVILTGCDDTIPMSNEQLIKDRQYCMDNGYMPLTRRAAWDGAPIYIECMPRKVPPPPVDCKKVIDNSAQVE